MIYKGAFSVPGLYICEYLLCSVSREYLLLGNISMLSLYHTIAFHWHSISLYFKWQFNKYKDHNYMYPNMVIDTEGSKVYLEVLNIVFYTRFQTSVPFKSRREPDFK